MWAHIAERFLIHFFSSMGILTGVFFTIRSLGRRYPRWIPVHIGPQLIMAGLIVFAVASCREVYDVFNGQPLLKAYTDYLSWLSGDGVSIWANYRLIMLEWERL